jgi:KipI family sensor histidine kinase inhibitor
MLYDQPQIKPNGDRGLRIAFGDERTIRVNRKVRKLAHMFQSAALPGVTEIIPTYASLTVLYDPLQVDYTNLVEYLQPLIKESMTASGEEESSRLLIVPVCYEGEYAPDMNFICDYTKLQPERVIALHTAEPYYVFQLGFTPGCPFIGPLQEDLNVPLMETPRTHTPMGAVAISIGQTVIYPRATPGGMRIIGRTPVKLFQLDHPALTLFRPGDRVLFRAISQAEFLTIEKEAVELMMGIEIKNDV